MARGVDIQAPGHADCVHRHLQRVEAVLAAGVGVGGGNILSNHVD